MPINDRAHELTIPIQECLPVFKSVVEVEEGLTAAAVDVEDIFDGQESNKNTGEMAGEKFFSSAVSTLDISMRLLWTLI